MDSLDKLYFKLNRELDFIDENSNVEEMIENFKRINHFIEEQNLAGEILFSTNKEKFLNPILVKLATNKDLYYEYAEPLTYMSYEKYMNGIALLSDEEIFNYLKNNMEYTSHNNTIESMWMDKFIATHINKKICPSIFSSILNSKKNDEFRVFCDSLLKKKASDFSIKVTSNPITLLEYLNKTRATRNIKLTLKRINEYLRNKGNCNSSNVINLNLTTLKLMRTLSFKSDVDYTLLEVIYHELAYAKIENQASIQYPFFDRNMYMQQKYKIFLYDDHEYYLNNHDYFENEIVADVTSYLDLMNDLGEYEHKDYTKLLKDKEDKMIKYRVLRTSKKYYEIEDRFDKLLINNPEFIKINKWLKYEYNSDGTRKEISEIINERNNFTSLLNKHIISEVLFGNKKNKTLAYLSGYELIKEPDNLFYEMIYRKIKEYTPEQFDEILLNCSSEILDEIAAAINLNQDTLFEQYDMLEQNSLSSSDFSDNKNFLDSLLARNREYVGILSRHIKQKKIK